jgi:hypothetical protein
MVAASVSSALGLSYGIDPSGPEVLLGMIGPLAAASVTWVMMERTYRRDPERLTPLMLKAFAIKMVFFGVYVTVALNGLALRPRPFVGSFVAYFIALHLTEALWLRRLIADRLSAS